MPDDFEAKQFWVQKKETGGRKRKGDKFHNQNSNLRVNGSVEK